jgi:purine-binding chemotaxis protein CheW
MRVLVFDIDGQRFGLDAASVREVLPAATLTQLPNLPPAIEGVLDVRGVVVPIISVRRALGLDHRTLRSTDHLVIASSRERIVGLHVDHAVEIVDLEDSDVDDSSTDSVARVARLNGGLMSVHLVDAIVGDWQIGEWHTDAVTADHEFSAESVDVGADANGGESDARD